MSYDWSGPLIDAKNQIKQAEQLLALAHSDPFMETEAAGHIEQAMVQLARILAWTQK